jgi:aquaporin Z
MTVLQSLRLHWPEYLIEGWALGIFMISAGVIATLFEFPGSPLHGLIGDPPLRRILIGTAMGLTAIALIYSPWGRRSGAHMNPAVTLAFWSLGKTAGPDAMFYVLTQFAGGAAGVLLVAGVLGAPFTGPPVSYAATLPGEPGVSAAFAAEFTISLGMMMMILVASNVSRLAPYTGVLAGCLVAMYISVEAPLSGMSMNPARTLASALPGGLWQHLWIYFTAPPLGMLCAAGIYLAVAGKSRIGCAKLRHSSDVRCIHCGYEPSPARATQYSGRSMA